MSVRVAGPVWARVFEVEGLEARRLLAEVGGAVAWDLKTPIEGELSQKGEVDYYRFEARAGEQIVFNSVGMKKFTVLDSDGTTELNQLLILDGVVPQPPGRLVWEAPHEGTFYVAVAGYTAFLIDSPTGEYSLAAYEVDETRRPEDGPVIAAGQEIHGDFSSAGDIDYYTFDAKAGTIYRFELAWLAPPLGSGLTEHHVMGVVEAQPWSPMPTQPDDAEEAYPGHNLRFTNLDEQKALGRFAEWVAPVSGRYHLSVAPLDEANARPYTLVMNSRGFPCDPQVGWMPADDWLLTLSSQLLQKEGNSQEATSKNTRPKGSEHSGQRRKTNLHHRRHSGDKGEKQSAKGHSNSARRKSLLLGKDLKQRKRDGLRLFGRGGIGSS